MSVLLQRVCGLLAAAATLSVAPACDRPDPLPTDPMISAVVRPQAWIVGTDVTVLPFFPASDINEAGQVVGRNTLWTPTEGPRNLGSLGGGNTWAAAINDVGQVVGVSDTPTGASHAFLWTPGGGMQDLGTLGGTSSSAASINNRGQVVGTSSTAGGAHHAFLWIPGQGMRDLGALGHASDPFLAGNLTSSSAADINEAGQIVGASYDPNAMQASRPTLWLPSGAMVDLGGPGYGVARAINEAGQVVGVITPGPRHAFLWTPADGMRDLGVLPSPGWINSEGWDIDDAGQVLGNCDDGSPRRRACLWTADHGFEEIPLSTGLTLAEAINNRQQVVGQDRLVTVHLGSSNHAPVASIGGPYTGTEGSVVFFAFSATDADDDALTFTMDLGDGAKVTGPWPIQGHLYTDNGTYTVTLTVSDWKDGTDTKSTTVTIANVAPSIPASGGLTGPAAPIPLVGGGANASIGLAFTDPALSRDRYAAEIACGNGMTISPTDITSPHMATCTYTSAGLYTVRAVVADEDGGKSAPAVYRYVIVYDPEGAFATGSGFYTVPGQGNHKAHFTFGVTWPTARAAMPNGTVKIWIPGGQLDFEASTIEMLVASGNFAQFWGTGTLNGAPARFRITAVDGQARGRQSGGDAVRIELWRAGSLVFDTQPGAAQDVPPTTAIEGGNIKIQE